VKLTSENDAVATRLEAEDEAVDGEAAEESFSDVAGHGWRTSGVLDLTVNKEGQYIPE
jgi:hypothetical protein